MRKRAPYIVAFLLGCLLMLCVFIYLNSPTVEAAAPVSIVMCGKIATTGPIDFYFCETDFGNFFVNSAGFMALEE